MRLKSFCVRQKKQRKNKLHTPMRNKFQIKELALLLVGAVTLPNLFNAIKLQYQLCLDFFSLKNAGMVFVRGVRDKGDIEDRKSVV